MIWVTGASYGGEYRLCVEFNDGRRGIVDLRNAIFSDPRAIFRSLEDQDFFRRFEVALDTIVWENGLDLAPEFLYERVVPSREQRLA